MSVSHLIISALDSYRLIFRGFCTGQGFFIQFTEITIFVWVTFISGYIFKQIRSETKRRLPIKHEIISYLVIVLLGLLFSALPLIIIGPSVYNIEGIWCWISNFYSAERFLFSYLPITFLSVILLILYILTKLSGKFKFIDPILRKLSVYPIIVFALFFFPTINRIYETLFESNLFPLHVLHIISSSFIGLVIALYFEFEHSRILLLWCIKKFTRKEVAEKTTIEMGIPRSLVDEEFPDDQEMVRSDKSINLQ